MKEIKDIYETINTLYNAYYNTEDNNIKKIYKDMYLNCIDTLKKIEKKDNYYYQTLLNRLNEEIELPKENTPKEKETTEYTITDIKSKDKNKLKQCINIFMNEILKELNFSLKDEYIFDNSGNKVSKDTFLKIMYANIKLKLLRNDIDSTLFSKEYINSRLTSLLLNKKYNYKYENKFPKQEIENIREISEKEELMQKGLGRF